MSLACEVDPVDPGLGGFCMTVIDFIKLSSLANYRVDALAFLRLAGDLSSPLLILYFKLGLAELLTDLLTFS